MAATQRVDCATDVSMDKNDDQTPTDAVQWPWQPLLPPPTDAEQWPWQPLLPPPTYEEAITMSLGADDGSREAAVREYPSTCDREDATTHVTPDDQVCH